MESKRRARLPADWHGIFFLHRRTRLPISPPPPPVTQFARHLFPGFLLAGIAVVLFCFAPFSGRDTVEDALLFEAQLSAVADGSPRLSCLREGATAPEAQSATEVKTSDQRSARFKIPAGRYLAFRMQLPASVKVESARVVDLTGVELARLEKERFQVAGEGAVWIFQCAPPLVLRSSLSWSLRQCAALLLPVALLVALLLWRFAARWKNAGDAGAAILARAGDFARRRPVATLLAVAVAAAVASCYPVVFCGKSFVSPNNGAHCLYAGITTLPGAAAEKTENPKMSDIGAMMWAHLPYSVLENRALFHDHELPLRLRDNSCGVPLLGQGQAMLGDPLHWIPICAGGATWAWDVKFVLAKILFAFGIGLLVRAAVGRLGVAVALTGSSAFIGFFAYRFNHAAFFSLCYAPWILLAWLKIARAPAWRAAVPWVALLGAANWTELNSGTAKEASMLICGLNFTGLLALALAPESLAARARKLAAAGAGLLIFLLVSAPCWVLFLDALAHAWTAYNVPHAYQIQPALLIGLFDDLFYRQTAPVENHTNPSANFFVLIGVLWALVHARRLAANRLFLALALAAVPFLALAFGVIPPALLTRLPFVGNISHVDNTFSCVLLVLLFPLAGFGFQACRERMAAADWRDDWTLMLVFLAVLGAAFFGCIQAEPRVTSGLVHGTGPVVKSAFFIRYATALFLAVALLPWVAQRLLHLRAWTLANVLLATLSLFALHFRHGMYVATKFDDYVMNPKERFDFSTPWPAVRYVKTHLAEPARVAGFGDVLVPGFNSAIGLESIGGADALVSPYYREFIEAAKLPMIWDWRLYFDRDNVPVLLPLYDLLNLRYYLGIPGESPSGVGGLQRIGTSDLDIFASPTVWPRAFFTDTLARYGTADHFARMVWEGDRRPFAAVQESESSSSLPTALPGRQVVAADDYRLTSNTTTFTVEAVAAGVAVLTETYEAENFRVTVNGTPARYFRANHAFCGVHIPQAGRYTITFSYWPRLLTPALWFSAAGLALLAVTLAMIFTTRPRKDGTGPA